MILITLEEAKERLSKDGDVNDNDIIVMINGIEGYLFNSTCINLSKLKTQAEEIISAIEIDPGKELTDIENVILATYNCAREYVLFCLYIGYYPSNSQLDEDRKTRLIKQLQVNSLLV